MWLVCRCGHEQEAFAAEKHELICTNCGRIGCFDISTAEWQCPECKITGMYREIRNPIDRGVDTCPICWVKVECVA